ncbi:hypothetical protein PLICRDRAFT_45345 [Plicaturopsis crispa FD-325 SS-3]|uniref:NmrA-like domain-containing protein n=1 Tax=Plicaturopsis crispa FD-325 SS-3 TaxID=944288 RepID=A0A0C9SYP5_PLICR|nr:hypothetical protein PLICRDRAFT_45345 [Plicaturopsis crispa FD-325 SS-3]
MSFTTTARMSRSRYAVAIAGATSPFGQTLAETFLSPKSYGAFFSQVICLVEEGPEDEAAASALKYVDRGARVEGVAYTAAGRVSLKSALNGVDAVVNALPHQDSSLGSKSDILFEAALDAGVTVYFAGDFADSHPSAGQDDFDDSASTAESDTSVDSVEEFFREAASHSIPEPPPASDSDSTSSFSSDSDDDETPPAQPAARHSTRHDSRCHALLQQRGKSEKVKVVHVHTGMFLEDFESSNGYFAGPVTSRSDMARSIAELIILHGTRTTIPDEVRIAGCILGESRDERTPDENDLVNPQGSVWEWTQCGLAAEELARRQDRHIPRKSEPAGDSA